MRIISSMLSFLLVILLGICLNLPETNPENSENCLELEGEAFKVDSDWKGFYTYFFLISVRHRTEHDPAFDSIGLRCSYPRGKDWEQNIPLKNMVVHNSGWVKHMEFSMSLNMEIMVSNATSKIMYCMIELESEGCPLHGSFYTIIPGIMSLPDRKDGNLGKDITFWKN
jgi:hypothetical protein